MISRYDYAKQTRNDKGKEVRTSLTLPTVAEQENDVYIMTNSTDRLDGLANHFYGDPRYWWVIAVVNNLGKGTLMVPAGLQLRIPANPSTVMNEVQNINK